MVCKALRVEFTEDPISRILPSQTWAVTRHAQGDSDFARFPGLKWRNPLL
jgi:hypothetical protein